MKFSDRSIEQKIVITVLAIGLLIGIGLIFASLFEHCNSRKFERNREKIREKQTNAQATGDAHSANSTFSEGKANAVEQILAERAGELEKKKAEVEAAREKVKQVQNANFAGITNDEVRRRLCELYKDCQ